MLRTTGQKEETMKDNLSKNKLKLVIGLAIAFGTMYGTEKLLASMNKQDEPANSSYQAPVEVPKPSITETAPAENPTSVQGAQTSTKPQSVSTPKNTTSTPATSTAPQAAQPTSPQPQQNNNQTTRNNTQNNTIVDQNNEETPPTTEENEQSNNNQNNAQ